MAHTAVSYRSSGIISAMPTHECGSSRGYGTVVRCGRLAQLVRAPPLHGGCRGFESLIAHFSQRREKSRNRISSRVISTRAPVFCPHSTHVLFVFCRKVHVIAKSPKPNGPGGFSYTRENREKSWFTCPCRTRAGEYRSNRSLRSAASQHSCLRSWPRTARCWSLRHPDVPASG